MPTSAWTSSVSATTGSGTYAGTASGTFDYTASAAGQNTTGPVPLAAYNFDQTSGTSINDVTGNGHTMTVTNAIVGAVGHTNQGLKANSALGGPQATVSSVGLLTSSARTVMFWAQRGVAASGTFGFTFWTENTSGSSNFGLGVQTSTDVVWARATNASGSTWTWSTSTVAMKPVGEWHHYAMTFSTTNGPRVYIDGTLAVTGSGTWSGGLTTECNGNLLRFFLNSANEQVMDDFRIYDVELTAAQVTDAMGTPVGGTAVQGVGTASGSYAFGSSVSSLNGKWPVSVSASGRNFLDQNGAPILWQGDTVWGWPSGVGSFGNSWQSDVDTYINTRADQGFNMLYIGLLPNPVNGGGTYSDRTNDGVHVFNMTTAGDYLTQHPSNGLNETYWARIDYLLTAAEAKGITVMMDVCYTDDVEGPGVLDLNHNNKTTAEFQAYGTAVGTRYKNNPNIIWTYGGDWYDGSQPDGLMNDFRTALQTAGDTHLWGIQYMAQKTSRYDQNGGTAGIINGPVWADFNFCYAYNPTYLLTQKAWNEAVDHSLTGARANLPTLHADGVYDTGNEDAMRNEYGWDLTTGSQGWNYGANGQWPGDVGTNSGSLTTNPFTNSHFKAMTTWFRGLTNWHLLVPDLANTFLTAGYGTRDAALGIGSSAGGYDTQTSDYCTAAKTDDGKLAVVYMPRGSNTITVDTTQLVTNYAAFWVDPTTGVATVTTKGTTYTKGATTNAAGQADWFLLLAESIPSTGTVNTGGADIYTYTDGTVTGVNPTGGTTSGSYSYTATVSSNIVYSGVAGADYTYTSSVTGTKPGVNTAAGSWTYTGSAAATTTRSGTAGTTWTFTGVASTSGMRDIRIYGVTAPESKWIDGTVFNNWTSPAPDNNWKSSEVPSNWTTTGPES